MPLSAALTLAEARAIRDLLRTDPKAGREQLEAFAARVSDSPLHGALIDLLVAMDAYVGGRYAIAETSGRRCLERALAIDAIELAADAAVLLGAVEYERGEYAVATEHYTAAASYLERAGAFHDLGRIYNNLGLIAWRLRDLPRAESNFDLALRHYGPDAEPRIRGNIHNNLGLVYEDGGDPGAAEAAYRRAVELLRDAGDDEYLANALANLGDLTFAHGAYLSARRLHAEALEARHRVGHQRGVATSRIALGRIAFELGERETCERELTEGLRLARQIGLRKQEADALSLRARLAEREGGYASALADERAAAALREQLFGEQMSERVAALQLRFDTWQVRLRARRAEEERARLAASMEALEAASAARTQFLARISHELRTPLASVVGAAELLRVAAIDPKQRHLVDVVIASAEALLAAVGDVLDLTRAEREELVLSVEPVSPARVAEQVVAMSAGAAEARGLGLTLDVAPSVPAWVEADSGRLRQLVLNLVANAIKFTDVGRVDLRLAWASGRLRVEVSDTGIGIPDTFAPRVFEPFSQADTSRTRRHGGAGLGLTIAKRIVDAMGGSIHFRSTEGVGTTFVVELPLAPSAPPPPAAARADRGRFRALLVEDDASVREVLSELLALCGADVRAVADGEAAIEACAVRLPDLVVLDIHMPGLDGLEVARQLRAAHGARVRILGLSGATSQEDRDAALAAGMDGWLPKPVPLPRLSAEIDRLGVPRG